MKQRTNAIGRAVYLARACQQISTATLARRARMSVATLNRIERGVRPASIREARRLLSALSRRLDALGRNGATR